MTVSFFKTIAIMSQVMSYNSRMGINHSLMSGKEKGDVISISPFL